MLKLLLSVSAFLSFTILNAQSLVTAGIFHGNDSQINTGVATDNSGNIYTSISFYGNVDADPGPGTTNFISAGSLDAAVTKLNSAGDFQWAIHFAGNIFGAITFIKTDNAGNIFVFGIFSGTIDMDPTGATFNLVSSGSDDIFCAKYNSSGTLIWAVKTGGTGTEQQYGFDLDSNGDLYLHGYFQNTVDFNPGAGTFNLTAGISGSDFLLKLNNDGTFNYAMLMSATYGNYLTIDPSDNIYITGLFWGTVDFNPGVGTFNLTAAGFDADCFVLKLNSSGGFLWAKAISGNNSEQGTTLDFDATTSSIFVGGFYEGTIDADPGPGTSNLVSAGYVDGFIIKLEAADGDFIWGRSFGGLGYQSVISLKISSSGNVHATGPFEQTADFDPSGTTYNLVSSGYTDIFKFQWTNDGTFSSAEKIGANNSEWSYQIDFDNEGAEILVGYFDGIVDFDPGVEVFNLNSMFTGWDGFLAKYCTVYTINNTVTICEGESYFAEGANQTEPGDYYDYFTPVEGCDSIVITHLFVNDPDVDLGPNTGICAGTSLILDAENTGADYIWNTGALTQTINVTTAGTYSVTVTDAAGCIAADAITISVDPSPVVNLGADITICSGETTILNAGNPGATYLWSTGAITQTIIVSATGNYSVTVTNGFDCTDFDLIHVNVTAAPVVDLGPNISECNGTIITLDAENPGATYLWSTGATTQTINVSTTGTYSVTATIGSCSDNDAINVTINPNPDVNLGADIFLCEGENVILNAGNPGANYLWNTGAITQTINVNATGNYSVTVTNGFDCTDFDLIHVTVTAAPIVDLGPDNSICAGNVITLDAENPGATYLWSTGATTQTINVTTAGTFSVTASIGSCNDNDVIQITVDPNPNVNLGPDVSICEGETIILNAGNPGATYLWNTGAITQTITVNTTGNYSVTVTNGFDCTDNDIVHVEVNDLPTLDLGPTINLCEGENVILNAGNPGATYIWSTGETTQTILVDEDGNYSVEVTNIFGCEAEDIVTVNINSSPEIDLGDDIEVCAGETVILNAATPMCTYLWSTGETTSSITITESGIYSVVVTNASGCSDTDIINVTVNPSPAVDLGDDLSICDGTTSILDATNPTSTYLWNTGETTSSINITEAGFYSVTVTNIFGCIGYDEINIGIFETPVIDLGADTTFCANSTLILDATWPASTYLWNNGATTSTITVFEAGIYSVLVTNSFGCIGADTIAVNIYPATTIIFSLPDSLICSDAEPFELTGATPTGGTYSGTGVEDGIFDPVTAGLGTHIIFYTYNDINGCSSVASQEIEVTICQAIENAEGENLIVIYPNPTMENFTIHSSESMEINSVHIYDMLGKEIYALNEHVGVSEINITTGNFPSGNYIIAIQSGKNIFTYPLIVTK